MVGAGRSCAETRQVYAEKGYSTGSAPVTQISGKCTFCVAKLRRGWLNIVSESAVVGFLYIFLASTAPGKVQ